MKKQFLILCLVLCCLLFSSCTMTEPSSHSELFIMDTVYTQDIYGPEEILSSNAQILQQIDQTFSKTNKHSEIFCLNENAQYQVSDDVEYVLDYAVQIANDTSGAFDPALKTLVDLWDINPEHDASVPSQKEILDALQSSGYENIKKDENSYTLENGVQIDLGGIVKGYALDRLYENTKQNGSTSALLNLGGSIAVLGVKPSGDPYKIGIRDPQSDTQTYFASIELQDAFTSTSGIYERYFISDHIRYHHILDRNTGYPAKNGLVSVTVVDDSGILTDAYSTALFVMGLKNGLSYANENHIDAVFVTEDNKVFLTDGFSEKYHFELTGDNYEVG